ncbi:MAG: DNA (cytosine-5-)-methyltransferase [Acidobacteria bacterium]|nr:DNA (cytosine-5-)-methyltransferase [Acidobacteriota bacterium]
MDRNKGESLTAVGLFAGIGGIERGLELANHRAQLLCEIDPGARRVLECHFDVEIEADVRRLGSFPKVDLIAAGFPCQDLSQAGRTAGIAGEQSGLIGEVFRRLRDRRNGPRWLLLENVPFMLQLQRGKAMRYLVDELEDLGFTWAYRVVDTRAFGLPQRRQRVLLLASRTEDPRPVLFGCEAGESLPSFSERRLCGFYWTEGLRGLGWAVDAVPTLKGGSTIGIPSPPAIWDPLDHSISTPDIRDAERLQGFDVDWTASALEANSVKRGHRWKLVGNAVSVPVSEWIGRRLARPDGEAPTSTLLKRGVSWPRAAWGHKEKVYGVDVSTWPVRERRIPLRQFLRFPRTLLSHRAAAGFFARANDSCLHFEENFLNDVRLHVDRMARNLDDSDATTIAQPACA